MDFDCKACGACCCAGFDVALFAGDVERFERAPALLSLTILHQGRTGPPIRFMQKDASGRCVALAGRLGECACTIYPDRPMLCDAFEAGSDDCRAARRRFGLPISDAAGGK